LHDVCLYFYDIPANAHPKMVRTFGSSRQCWENGTELLFDANSIWAAIVFPHWLWPFSANSAMAQCSNQPDFFWFANTDMSLVAQLF
jgi:hypothetical protein